MKAVVETVSCIQQAYLLSTLPLDRCKVTNVLSTLPVDITGVVIAKHTLQWNKTRNMMDIFNAIQSGQ